MQPLKTLNSYLLRIEEYLRVFRHIDRKYYRAQLDSDKLIVSPVRHYLVRGYKEGKNPTPSFSTNDYLDQNPDVKQSQINPFFHFLKHGRKEGRNINTKWTGSRVDRALNVNIGQVKTDALNSAFKRGISNDFDRQFYLKRNPDVQKAGTDPVEHYCKFGWREGRDPHPCFSTGYYLAAYTDVATSGINPFYHYVQFGRAEGRKALPPERERILNQLLEVNDHCAAFTLPCYGGIPKTRISIAVHFHLYFAECVEEAVKVLARMPVGFCLHVSSDSADKVELLQKALIQAGIECDVDVDILPNRGRNVWPLLQVLERLSKFDVALHFHTKRSMEKQEIGRKWFVDCLDDLAYSSSYIANILRLFESDPALGLLMPLPSAEIRTMMTWGEDQRIAESILARCGIEAELPDQPPPFPAGMMFWFRPGALATLNERFDLNDFPEEPIRADGTMGHALERVLPVIVSSTGYDFGSVTPDRQTWENLRFTDKVSVSIVIPLCNKHPWISHALKSAVSQQVYGIKIEVIVVINGSTDRSAELARSYEAAYSFVRVIEEPIKGAGNARNAGLRASRGKCVMFLDADDVLSKYAVEVLYRAIENESESDLAVSQLCIFSGKDISDPIPFYYNASKSCWKVPVGEYTQTGADYNMTLVEDQSIHQLMGDFGACAKLYRKEFLELNGIKFPSSMNYEDNIFVYSCYLSAKEIAFVAEPTYLYRKEEDPIRTTQSTRIDRRSFSDQCAALERIVDMTSGITNSRLRSIMAFRLAEKLSEWEPRIASMPREQGQSAMRELKTVRMRISKELTSNSNCRLIEDREAG